MSANEERIQNNSAYHREWFGKVRRDAKKQGVIAGFEYAVQPDGTCFAERRWEELRQLGGFKFLNVQEQDGRRLYQIDQVEIPEGTEPFYGATESTNAVRTDDVVASFEREKILENAPDSDGEFYRVPPVF